MAYTDQEKREALEDTEQCLEQGVAVGDDNAAILAASLRLADSELAEAWREVEVLKKERDAWMLMSRANTASSFRDAINQSRDGKININGIEMRNERL